MLVTMISGFKASVQNELNAFFAHLDNHADLHHRVSAQAFSKARAQFSHTAFEQLNAHLLALVARHLTVPRWNGLRIVAGDASKMRLFLQDASKRCVREVIAFALYLPGVEMTLTAQLYGPTDNERQMLFEHLHHLDDNDLLVLDRGYPAYWLIAHLLQRKRHFCMRIDQLNFKEVKRFWRSGLAEQIVQFDAPKFRDCEDYDCLPLPSTVRLVRVATPNGRMHVVVTSLLDGQQFPAEQFAALYHSRWRIEEAFKRLKHRLALENTSGLSWLAAQQDFAAKILADNLHALSVLQAGPDLQPGYKINRTQAFALLKRCLPRWLLGNLPSARQLAAVVAEILRNVVKFCPGASKPRCHKYKPHLKHAYKSTC